MKTNYILIDYENVQIRSLERLQGSQFKVLVFLEPNNTRLPVELVLSVQRMGEHASYVAMEAGGTNALDFHIAYYIGHLSSTDPTAFFHIISKDTGFDPLIQHLKGRKIFAARSISIDEMPCFKTPSSTSTGNPPSQTLATIASAPDAANKPESLLRPVLEDLIKRKASKPRAVKTLKSTLQAKCGKDLPPAVIDGLFSLLVKRGFVLVDGTKVSYALPPCPEGKLAAGQSHRHVMNPSTSARNSSDAAAISLLFFIPTLLVVLRRNRFITIWRTIARLLAAKPLRVRDWSSAS